MNTQSKKPIKTPSLAYAKKQQNTTASLQLVYQCPVPGCYSSFLTDKGWCMHWTKSPTCAVCIMQCQKLYDSKVNTSKTSAGLLANNKPFIAWEEKSQQYSVVADINNQESIYSNIDTDTSHLQSRSHAPISHTNNQ